MAVSKSIATKRSIPSTHYIGTTIVAIAEGADASVETIYKGFGGSSRLP